MCVWEGWVDGVALSRTCDSELCVCVCVLDPEPLPSPLACRPALPAAQGYGLTYILMFTRLRLGLHKHAKEGLLCLLESCTGDEYARVGGPGWACGGGCGGGWLRGIRLWCAVL